MTAYYLAVYNYPLVSHSLGQNNKEITMKMNFLQIRFLCLYKSIFKIVVDTCIKLGWII